MVKRSIINVNITAYREYAYIDHVKGGNQFGGGGSATWQTGTVWMQQIDANGWPTYSTTTRTAPLSGIYIPASTDFAGPYTIDGRGTGRIQLTVGTWTLGVATGVTQVSNGLYTVTDSGSGWTAQLTFSGTLPTTGVSMNATQNDPSATGAYIRNVRFYRTADAADLAAGKVFRAPWKQAMVDLNPGAIRFMNWTGANAARNARFEQRTKPAHAMWTATRYNWVASPPYGETTGVNQYTLASVTGTTTSMTHGELATCRIGSGVVRGNSPTVTAISKATQGRVTAAGHGFNVGDKVIHLLVTGMTQLDYLPVTITNVVDADNYDINVNTTSFGTFTGTCRAEQFVTLQVGSGSDRTAYPITFPDGLTLANHFGSAYIATGDYKSFIFDKSSAIQKDAAGNWVYGVWLYGDAGGDYGHEGGTPLEICTACVNELMAMTRSDGGVVGPIDMWITVPHMGLLSMDPDYSAGSNFAVGTVDVCLNGANGYAGLDSRCKLYVEHSNETWNTANMAFAQSLYQRRQGFLRWPASGTSDTSSYSMLRSMVMVKDILAGGFTRARLKLILAGQGTMGTNGTSTLNDVRMNGSTYVLTDPLNVGGVTPMSVHDSFAWAAYIEPTAAFDTANLTTLAASWVSHASDLVAQEADCAGYVVGMENTGVTASGNETLYRYRESLLPAFAARLVALGKTTLMYEGGWNKTVTGGTTDVNNFLVAVKRSRAWANALVGLFNRFDSVTGADMPSDYIQLDSRWGHLVTDPYTYNVGGVEWSGIDLAWKLSALRNCGKRQMLVKT